MRLSVFVCVFGCVNTCVQMCEDGHDCVCVCTYVCVSCAPFTDEPDGPSTVFVCVCTYVCCVYPLHPLQMGLIDGPSKIVFVCLCLCIWLCVLLYADVCTCADGPDGPSTIA